MPRNQEDTWKVSNGDTLGIIYLVALSHATAITPFIRKGFGSESLGLNAILAFFGILLMVDGGWSSGMGLYLLAWFVALIARRIETFNLWRKGLVWHSHFGGHPWLALRFTGNVTQAKCLEPFLCLLAGLALYPLSPRVGGFVTCGFLSLWASLGIEKLFLFKRVRDMRDAQIEGEFYAEEFMRGQ